MCRVSEEIQAKRQHCTSHDATYPWSPTPRNICKYLIWRSNWIFLLPVVVIMYIPLFSQECNNCRKQFRRKSNIVVHLRSCGIFRKVRSLILECFQNVRKISFHVSPFFLYQLIKFTSYFFTRRWSHSRGIWGCISFRWNLTILMHLRGITLVSPNSFANNVRRTRGTFRNICGTFEFVSLRPKLSRFLQMARGNFR